MRKAMAVIAGCALCASTALAGGDLNGTEMDLIINHTGDFGEPVGGVYEYGTSMEFFDSFNFSWTATSPAGFGGFDNSIMIDFTNFAYTDFGGETGTVDIDGIDIDVDGGSAGLFNGSGTKIGFNMSSSGGSIDGNFSVDDILNNDGFTLVIAWNNIPGPGALALLGMAGVLAGRRRRRG